MPPVVIAEANPSARVVFPVPPAPPRIVSFPWGSHLSHIQVIGLTVTSEALVSVTVAFGFPFWSAALPLITMAVVCPVASAMMGAGSPCSITASCKVGSRFKSSLVAFGCNASQSTTSPFSGSPSACTSTIKTVQFNASRISFTALACLNPASSLSGQIKTISPRNGSKSALSWLVEPPLVVAYNPNLIRASAHFSPSTKIITSAPIKVCCL